jgi:TATA binding protein of transcription factor TFIID
VKVLENEDNEDESFEEENVNEKEESGKPTVKIENIVATVILDTALDLNLIETRIPDVDYNPDQFPGLVYRLQNPKITALIFKSGKMVVTGAKSVKQLVWAVKTILKKLMIKRVPMQGKPQIQIQTSLHRQILM